MYWNDWRESHSPCATTMTTGCAQRAAGSIGQEPISANSSAAYPDLLGIDEGSARVSRAGLGGPPSLISSASRRRTTRGRPTRFTMAPTGSHDVLPRTHDAKFRSREFQPGAMTFDRAQFLTPCLSRWSGRFLCKRPAPRQETERLPLWAGNGRESSLSILSKRAKTSQPMLIRSSRRDRRLIDSCRALLANVTPFRGPSADVGTAWEMGYASGQGKPVVAYSDDLSVYREKVFRDRWSGAPC